MLNKTISASIVNVVDALFLFLFFSLGIIDKNSW